MRWEGCDGSIGRYSRAGGVTGLVIRALGTAAFPGATLARVGRLAAVQGPLRDHRWIR